MMKKGASGIGIVVPIILGLIAVILMIIWATGALEPAKNTFTFLKYEECKATGSDFSDYEYWLSNYFEATTMTTPNLEDAKTKIALDFCSEALWCFGKTKASEIKPASNIKGSRAVSCCFDYFGEDLENKLGASYDDYKEMYGGKCS